MTVFQRLSQTTHGALSSAVFDILVIGGGIVGAGIARDAALRGLRVALVDQHDFAFGTSSRSSRLLHGGLRYLAQGRIGLVREASVEKLAIRRIAPHLAEPLPFLFPTYRRTAWPRWKLSAGARIYDLLCGRSNLGGSRTLSVSEITGMLPGIQRRNLTGGVRYFDGLTNDARLVIDTLRSASKAGATAANYVRFVHASRTSGGWDCLLQDAGSRGDLYARARVIVNAAGAWAPKIPRSRVRLRLTAGIHLVLDRNRFPVPEAVVMAEGNRILFAIPWGDRVIVGTTDTDYEGPLEDVRACDGDIRYVLEVVNSAFPQVGLGARDILSVFAGVRPLIAPSRVRKGAPSDISRSHQMRVPEAGWIDVTGGKLTTYRLMAEQTVDLVGGMLKRDLPACRTAREPLLDPSEVEGVSGILPPPPTQATVEHYCKHEWARHLGDVMLRRAGWHFYHRDADEIARKAAAWMAEILGWDAGRQAAEMLRYQQESPALAGLSPPA